MSFPKYEERGWWIFKRKTPSGWTPLGTVNPKINIDTKTLFVHDLCQSRIHVGRDETGIFQYCPRCMFKVILAERSKP